MSEIKTSAPDVIDQATTQVGADHTQAMEKGAMRTPPQDEKTFEGGQVKNTKDTVWVAKGFVFKPGQQLTDELVIEKELAHGVQAIVYTLKTPSGAKAPWLLKVAKAVPWISNFQREWETGRLLNNLSLEDGHLVGFMKMGAAIREMETERWRGLLMERLTGRSVDEAIIPDKNFCDIHYVREMLLHTFVALDEAQRAFGFHHADLRLSNVFENTPEDPDSAPDPMELIHEMSGRKYKPEPNHTSPKTQFKIIDFGLAKFDEALAADPETAANIGLGSENLAGGKKKKSLKLQNLPRDIASLPKDVVKSIKDVPEKVHQTAWNRKGDVYHVLFDLAVFIDGRIWPHGDKVDVELLLSVIYHVTGVRLRAYFAYPDKTPHIPKMMASCLLNGGTFYSFRQAVIRYWGWVHNFNSGISAAEVLTTPFFRVREVVSTGRKRLFYRRSQTNHATHGVPQEQTTPSPALHAETGAIDGPVALSTANGHANAEKAESAVKVGGDAPVYLKAGDVVENVILDGKIGAAPAGSEPVAVQA